MTTLGHGWWEAVRLLTILPAPPAGRGTRQGCLLFFPAVGVVIGLILAGAGALLALVSRGGAPELRSALLLGLWAVLSGGMHLDGLVDTLDGLLCPGDRAAAVNALKDSRAGAKGVAFTIVLLVLRWAALATLEGTAGYPRPHGAGRISVAAAVTAAAVVGRCAMVLGVVASRRTVMPESALLRATLEGEGDGTGGTGRTGRTSGTGGATDRTRAGTWPAAVSTAFLAGSALSLAWAVGAPAAAAATTGALFGAECLRRAAAARFGGVNGDVVGAMCEMAETVVLVIVALLQ